MIQTDANIMLQCLCVCCTLIAWHAFPLRDRGEYYYSTKQHNIACMYIYIYMYNHFTI